MFCNTRYTRPQRRYVGSSLQCAHEEDHSRSTRVSPVVTARVLAAAAVLAAGVAHAGTFHCVDAGVHVYRDSPCPAGARTAGITVSAPVEQRGRPDEDLRNEYDRVVAQQNEGLRRIEDLERQVADLRTALQSMQVAAADAATQAPAYPAASVQQPAYVAVPVPEPVYTTRSEEHTSELQS